MFAYYRSNGLNLHFQTLNNLESQSWKKAEPSGREKRQDQPEGEQRSQMAETCSWFWCFPAHPTQSPPAPRHRRPTTRLTDQLACGLIQTPSPPLPSWVTLGHSVGEGDSETAFKKRYGDRVAVQREPLSFLVNNWEAVISSSLCLVQGRG